MLFGAAHTHIAHIREDFPALNQGFFLFQALQSKHDALLKRVDELDNECEELRDRVLEAEGEKDELQGVVENLQTEKDKLSEELDSKQVNYVT